MRCFLINRNSKQSMEVLDEQLPIDVGSVMGIPKWGINKFIVDEIIYVAKTEGEDRTGYRCSFTENVYVSEKPDEETK